MKRAAIAFAALLLMAAREEGPTLVPDVSQRSVEILYSFTGAELLLFGAILYPGGKVPDGRTDVAVVLKGPSRSVLVREKQKLGGLIWANAGAARFRSAPAFYAVASSRPIEDLVDDRTAAIYELGLGSIHLSPAGGAAPVEAKRFVEGLVDLQSRDGLFFAQPGSVEISKGVLYRARLEIPPRVPEDEAVALLQAIKASGNKAGLCFHVGSQTLSPLPYTQALARVGAIIKQSGVKLDSLDVGGGYPVAYPGHDPAPVIDYMVALRDGLAKLKLPKGCQVYGEPGRALVAEAGSLLVQVELRKGDALYINDGVYGSLYDSGHFGLIHPVRLHRAAGRKATGTQTQGFTLYGPTCDSVDTIKGPYRLPADVQEGDWIEFGQTGSYTAALQSGFNGFFSDQTVLLADQPQLPTKGYWSK